MINIRYHIVSITAVFLALGIGVALGSTFLDRATVEVLDRNISSAEEGIRETDAENDRLQSLVNAAEERDAGLIVLGSDRLLAEQLTDIPVLVLAAPGVGSDQLDPITAVLARSGADLRGTLALSDRLRFDGDIDEALVEDLELIDPSGPRLRAEAFDRLLDALALAGQEPDLEVPGPPDGTDDPGASGDPTRPEAGVQPEVVSVLLAREYVALAPGPYLAEGEPILDTHGYRYVVVGAPDPTQADNDILLSLLPDEDDVAALPAVVVTVTQDPPPIDEQVVPTIVALARSSEALAERYTTVDDAETFSGIAAMVFSVADLGAVPAGHYGQADGASGVLPPLL